MAFSVELDEPKAIVMISCAPIHGARSSPAGGAVGCASAVSCTTMEWRRRASPTRARAWALLRRRISLSSSTRETRRIGPRETTWGSPSSQRWSICTAAVSRWRVRRRRFHLHRYAPCGAVRRRRRHSRKRFHLQEAPLGAPCARRHAPFMRKVANSTRERPHRATSCAKLPTLHAKQESLETLAPAVGSPLRTRKRVSPEGLTRSRRDYAAMYEPRGSTSVLPHRHTRRRRGREPSPSRRPSPW